MGALTFDALLRSLKQGAPDPVYYLHGDEDVLKDEAIRALVERAVDPAARDFNVDQRSAADLDSEAFHTLVNTPPLLEATRAVVIRGLGQLRKTTKVRQELVRYLDSPSPTTLLVLVQGAGEPPDTELASRATAVAVNPLPPARVERWVAHHASRLGLTLAPDAAELLLAAVGNDLAALARELEKLAAVAGSRPATRDEVAALVGVRRGETVQDLVDAALERRGAAAARLVEPVLEQAGMSGVRIVTALATALVGTALARARSEEHTSELQSPFLISYAVVCLKKKKVRPSQMVAPRVASSRSMTVLPGFGAGCFFFNDTATTEIYTRKDTLSLHAALPISVVEALERMLPDLRPDAIVVGGDLSQRSEEHTSELQSPFLISYAVFCLKK